jgi:hypothetical protein
VEYKREKLCYHCKKSSTVEILTVANLHLSPPSPDTITWLPLGSRPSLLLDYVVWMTSLHPHDRDGHNPHTDSERRDLRLQLGPLARRSTCSYELAVLVMSGELLAAILPLQKQVFLDMRCKGKRWTEPDTGCHQLHTWTATLKPWLFSYRSNCFCFVLFGLV